MNVARIFCAFQGHKRGKFQYQGVLFEGNRLKTYKCPRCGEEWTRKVKEPSQNGGTAGDQA